MKKKNKEEIFNGTNKEKIVKAVQIMVEIAIRIIERRENLVNK